MAQWVRTISNGTPVEKGAKLDKMKELEKRARHSGWKWISTKRTRSSQTEKMSEESNITMPLEERLEDRSLE